MTQNRLMMAEATTESLCTVLPVELMIEILSRVESSNPLELRCVCKLWNSIIIDPQFMENHILVSFPDFKDLLSKAFNDYMALESHIINNPVDDEKRSMMKAIDQTNDLIDNFRNYLREEKYEKKHWMMIRIDRLDHLLVIVRYMKENFETMRDIIQTLEDRVKCRQNCMRIYIKSATSSSS